MSKKITLTVSQKEAVLNFGANWFFEFYQKDTGHDLIKDPKMEMVDTGSTNLFPFLVSYLWAGYQTECAVNSSEMVLDKGDFKRFVMGGTEEDAVNLTWEIFAVRAGVSVEELKASAEKKEETAEKKS